MWPFIQIEKDFLFPKTGGNNLSHLEKLTEEDSRNLRKRTGLGDLDEIIPDQPSTLTEVASKYFDETAKKGKGVWLFQSDYGWIYGRTKNPLNAVGFPIRPGFWNNNVAEWNVDRWGWEDVGDVRIRVVRIVVAKKK